MTMPDRATRQYSFGAIADEYDRYRPGPPLEGVRWVLGEQRTTALDLGAGTGGLTRRLVRLVPRVVALEPDPRMRAVLMDRSGGAVVIGAVGERLPIADGTFDAVIASSSWHWMDPELAGVEVARVLRPGGVFGLLRSGPDRSVDWVSEVLGRRRWPASSRRPPDPQRWRRRTALRAGLPFSPPEFSAVRFTEAAGEDDLVGLSGTYSVMILGSGPERAARMEEVRARARDMLGPQSVALPMVCRCWRAFRLPS